MWSVSLGPLLARKVPPSCLIAKKMMFRGLPELTAPDICLEVVSSKTPKNKLEKFLAQLADLTHQSFLTERSRNAWMSEKKCWLRIGAICFCAYAQDNLVATVGLVPLSISMTGKVKGLVQGIHVSSTHTGQGLEEFLMTQLLKYARQKNFSRLSMNVTNAHVLSICQRIGFLSQERLSISQPTRVCLDLH